VEPLDDISVEDLQQVLENVEGKNPTERLLAGTAYKNGVAQAKLAEWYEFNDEQAIIESSLRLPRIQQSRTKRIQRDHSSGITDAMSWFSSTPQPPLSG